MTDRKIEFVNDADSDWNLVELGISVSASSSLDVTEIFRDFEIIGALQRGLADRFTESRYMKINGTTIDNTMAASWGSCGTKAGWPYLNADEQIPEKFIAGDQACIAIDTIGNQPIEGTPATLTLNSITTDSDYYELSGNLLKVLKDGTYWISYNLLYAAAGGNKKGAAGAWVEEDQGAGVWQEISGSRSCSFHYEGGGESGNGTSFPYKLSANDKLRIRIMRLTGTAVISTIVKSHLSLLRVAST